MATAMKSLGYSTGQFGKNHQGDRDEHLPTMHGFDEFLRNLYHLNVEEEPENEDYPGDMVMTMQEYPPSRSPGSFNLEGIQKNRSLGRSLSTFVASHQLRLHLYQVCSYSRAPGPNDVWLFKNNEEDCS
jgi:hypothetical protein